MRPFLKPLVMKPSLLLKSFLFILSIGTYSVSSACTCYESDINFYRSIEHPYNLTCLAVFISAHDNSNNGSYDLTLGWYDKLIVVDTVGQFTSDIGDTILIEGADGFSCGAWLPDSVLGDTFLFSLTLGYHRPFEADSFHLDGCGVHYKKMENGLFAGLTFEEA